MKTQWKSSVLSNLKVLCYLDNNKWIDTKWMLSILNDMRILITKNKVFSKMSQCTLYGVQHRTEKWVQTLLSKVRSKIYVTLVLDILLNISSILWLLISNMLRFNFLYWRGTFVIQRYYGMFFAKRPPPSESCETYKGETRISASAQLLYKC